MDVDRDASRVEIKVLNLLRERDPTNVKSVPSPASSINHARALTRGWTANASTC